MTRPPAAVAALVNAVLGESATRARPLSGGANSRVLKVTTSSGQRVVAKLYAPVAADGRDRLAVEFEALSFLWRHRVRNVPEPLGQDKQARVALYGFVGGRPVRASQIGPREVREAVELLGRLKQLSALRAARMLPDASEACFTIERHAGLIADRLQRLRGAVSHRRGAAADARKFLDERFRPRLECVIAGAIRQARQSGFSASRPLSRAGRTLSPSDCGFHNALRHDDGSLVFLDFEYFGWDDPAKAASDYCLHPRGAVPPALRRGFLEQLGARLGGAEELLARVRVVYPMIALKWCLIMLNEFLADALTRRRLALAPNDPEALKRRQLQKASRWLTRVEAELETPRFAPLAR